jgi:5-aminopentanamidase
MDVVFGDFERNTATVVAHLERLKIQGVDLAVFPEASLTGYCVDCLEEAQRISIPGVTAQEIGTALQTISEACERLDILAIVGFAERSGEDVHNAAVLFEPGVRPRTYRKTHLPELGLDRFVKPGTEIPLFETRLGRIGILICYDLRPPEATRVLALAGADILVLPTNWPEGAETSAEHVAITRAAENRIFVATCNRVGEENGFRFIGRSKIIHPTGRVLAAAGAEEETLMADLDLAEARQKRTVNIPGKYEIDVMGSRRPELYGTLGKLG